MSGRPEPEERPERPGDAARRALQAARGAQDGGSPPAMPGEDGTPPSDERQLAAREPQESQAPRAPRPGDAARAALRRAVAARRGAEEEGAEEGATLGRPSPTEAADSASAESEEPDAAAADAAVPEDARPADVARDALRAARRERERAAQARDTTRRAPRSAPVRRPTRPTASAEVAAFLANAFRMPTDDDTPADPSRTGTPLPPGETSGPATPSGTDGRVPKETGDRGTAAGGRGTGATQATRDDDADSGGRGSGHRTGADGWGSGDGSGATQATREADADSGGRGSGHRTGADGWGSGDGTGPADAAMPGTGAHASQPVVNDGTGTGTAASQEARDADREADAGGRRAGHGTGPAAAVFRGTSAQASQPVVNDGTGTGATHETRDGDLDAGSQGSGHGTGPAAAAFPGTAGHAPQPTADDGTAGRAPQPTSGTGIDTTAAPDPRYTTAPDPRHATAPDPRHAAAPDPRYTTAPDPRGAGRASWSASDTDAARSLTPHSMASPHRDSELRRTFPAFPPLPGEGDGRFAATWWGNAWITALEEGALDVQRLVRGRGYAARGQVDAITVTPGQVLAYVQGSRPRPYRVQVRLRTLGDADWERFLDAAADRPAHIAALLDKEMPQALADGAVPLLPGPGDLEPRCSCPDRGHPCKHAAALCYQTARLLDADPFVLLLLRGRGERELLDALSRLSAARAARAAQEREPAPLPGVRATDALAPRTLPPLPAPLPTPAHPEQPPAYPAAPGGPDPFALDQLATDAAARAHALLATGQDPVAELTLWEDAVRLAAARPGSGLTAATRGLYASLAAAAGRTPSELARAVAAWRQGGPDGLAVLEEPWDPPAGRFDRARPLLLAADFPAFRPWRNHLTHPRGHLQLRLGRDGLWYAYESDPGADDWWPRGTPDPDPVGALTGLGTSADI
ncbi:SWIM zinc finger family protein [Streptomyces sp. NPDC001595]|uniref:SWIM zinc finger family protein n=1 Tax=Streptomyces sp. NPDC001532 TaxID=3154520 RepID=UPI00331D8291